MTRILGISCHYHDAAATLLADGDVVAAAEEERFTRRKHDPAFPEQAIAFCLKQGGIEIGDVDQVVFYEKPLLKFERLLTQHVRHFPRGYKTFRMAMPSWLGEKLGFRKLFRKKLGYKGDVFFLEHHLSHAAGAFYPSPFEEAAILTLDGVGEWSTATMGMGRGTSVDLSHEIRFPHSLGLLYSTITAYLGFTVNNSEYKVMGLSAYGEHDPAINPYISKLRQVIDIKPDGSFRLDLSFFVYEYADRMPAAKLCDLLDGPIRRAGEPVTKRHEDVAAALQVITEEAMLTLLRHLHKITRCPNVVLAGGVALNSVANGKILSQSGFKDVWIQPNSGDGGSSMGAALHTHHAILGNPRKYVMRHAFLGPGYTSNEIETFLKEKNIVHSRFASRDALIEEAARLIHGDKVVGWFQGRMEWGPRALGARSILSNPCNPAMRDILNLKVKHREVFRPFAPSVCAEDAQKYFQCDDPIPLPADFMLMVYPVKPDWRDKLPAITHVDGSGRLQTVRRDQHSLYHDLIQAFGRFSGIPVVINTSFNIRGEPIVNTPEHAYRCMMGTGIDCLVMEDFLIRRDDNLRDAWDSEALAGD